MAMIFEFIFDFFFLRGSTNKKCDNYQSVNHLFLNRPNIIFRNFPNRDELLFLVVFAFPNDSNIGFVAKIIAAGSVSDLAPQVAARYLNFSCFRFSSTGFPRNNDRLGIPKVQKGFAGTLCYCI